MVLLSVGVLVLVLLAWNLRDLYLVQLSHLLVDIGARYFGFVS